MLKVNEYFGGKVKSISISTSEGPATIGAMVAGDYEFGTSQKEIMIVVSGNISAKLPGENEWKNFAAGDKFEVSANQKFLVKISEDTSYICYYK